MIIIIIIMIIIMKIIIIEITIEITIAVISTVAQLWPKENAQCTSSKVNVSPM